MLEIKQEKDFYQNVGKLIKSYRIKRDVSSEQLGKYIGLTRSSVVNIENGRQKILLHTLVEVAEFFNIGVAELLPLKQIFKNDISEEIKVKINQKISSEAQLIRLEDFINLSSNKKTKE